MDFMALSHLSESMFDIASLYAFGSLSNWLVNPMNSYLSGTRDSLVDLRRTRTLSVRTGGSNDVVLSCRGSSLDSSSKTSSRRLSAGKPFF
ncbi:UNVERIFIED_CONTAM: hypothetical protein Slati_4405500 [Sesamum latifolium]|uniref:Uncharacterized protein n=1 Tax=Sesamum latifolium TaxID=2727402 RepID=A0AAW2SPP1_9LAMI